MVVTQQLLAYMLRLVGVNLYSSVNFPLEIQVFPCPPMCSFIAKKSLNVNMIHLESILRCHILKLRPAQINPTTIVPQRKTLKADYCPFFQPWKLNYSNQIGQ